MNEKITIISRSDLNKPKIRIINNNFHRVEDVADNTVNHVRTHLLKRHSVFTVQMSSFEVNKYGVPFNELPSKLVALACSIKNHL